ncbi:MAG: hypothetical protein WC488_02945 [Candidatus Micrarchaeia archaeon]
MKDFFSKNKLTIVSAILVPAVVAALFGALAGIEITAGGASVSFNAPRAIGGVLSMEVLLLAFWLAKKLHAGALSALGKGNKIMDEKFGKKKP